MFAFKQVPLRKSKESDATLAKLESFLDREAPKLSTILSTIFEGQQNSITYKELREAALDGYEKQIQQWQVEYADFVNDTLAPLWKKAMDEAAEALNQKLYGLLVFDDSDVFVKDWLQKHGAEFVTNIGGQTRSAIKSILFLGQYEEWTTEKIAQMIRPCIGLARPDALANARYQQHVYNSLLKQGVKESAAARRAHEAALKYAARQHRARADMIANTELAYAYNRGTHESVRQAMRGGLMGPCVKVWSTAGSERVCSHCSYLNGKRIGFDESFDIPGRVLFEGMRQTPPAHPRCRCAVKYVEISPPQRQAELEIAARKKKVV